MATQTKTTSAPASATSPLKNGEVDWKLIETLEGGCVSKAYVPDPENSQSGVTVSFGVDLGQLDKIGLSILPVPEDLKDKLRPYIGLRKEKAVAALKAKPLNVPYAQGVQLYKAIKERNLKVLVLKYDRVSRVPFKDLPSAACTILASVGFQYGPNLNERCPTFWKWCRRQRWDDAINELRNFKDRYPTRRNKEADYLKSNMEKLKDEIKD